MDFNIDQKKQNGKHYILGLFTGMLLSGVFALIVCFGFLLAKVIKNPASAADVNVTGAGSLDADVISKVSAIKVLIEEEYSLAEVDEDTLNEGLYRGIVDAVGDVYSEYYSVEELEELNQYSEGIFYGIGAYISVDEQSTLPKIAGVMEGSPAEKAGVLENDIIYEVDGQSTYGLSTDEVVALVRGEKDTDVVLTMVRYGEADYVEIKITRGPVDERIVSHGMLEDYPEIGYIQISQFADSGVDQFAEALADCKAENMKGLIIDLRSNPGGTLNSVLEICRMILPKGLILYTEDKNGQRVEYTCDGKRELEVPIVVLVNGNTASAAEVMTGAIRDHGMGKIVGTTTFGKGIVQNVFRLNDGSAVKLTTESYFTPNGSYIHKLGIEPDVEIEYDREMALQEGKDVQILKAVEVLQDLMDD